MNERLRELRKILGLNQMDFSKRINIGSSTLAMFETGQRIPKDIHISQICTTYNVNENWLRYGTGEMFIEATAFSLDEYAKSQDLRESEINLIRGYMELDSKTRNSLYDMFKKAFANEIIQDPLSSNTSVDTELSCTIESLEEKYKKSVLNNVPNKVFTASNTIEDGKKKKA